MCKLQTMDAKLVLDCCKGVHLQSNGYFCPSHQWQRVPMYRFTLRVLLSDWRGSELWGTVFDETAAKALGISANTYVAMASEGDRYASLAPLRGARVTVTIKKRITDTYVNYTVSELEVIDS